MALPPFPSQEEVNKMIQGLTDAAKDYNESPDTDGIPSRMKLIALAKDLISSLRHPMDMGDVHIANGNELVAVRTLIHLKAFHAIPYPGTATLSVISKATNASEGLLERLLRMVVCTGFLLQPSPSVYAHTKHSYAYTLWPGPAMFFELVYDNSILMIDDLHVYLGEKGLEEPQDQRHSPYAWKSKQEGTAIWEIMAQHPERLRNFQAGLAHADASTPLLGYYDFAQLDTPNELDRPILVDVGGGAGYCMSQILEAYPQLPASKFVLQDLKEPINQAIREKVLPDEVKKIEHDFFQPQPIIGAKSYFLRRVLHDYSDTFCHEILSNLVPALLPDSRILIADLMFPEVVTPDDLRVASYDMTMFNMGGKERTEKGFRELFEGVGCELVRVWKSQAGFGVIVEARLKVKAEQGEEEEVGGVEGLANGGSAEAVNGGSE